MLNGGKTHTARKFKPKSLGRSSRFLCCALAHSVLRFHIINHNLVRKPHPSPNFANSPRATTSCVAFETPAHVMSSRKPRAQSPSSHAAGSDRSRGPRQGGAHGRRPPSPQRLPEHAHAKPRLRPRVPPQPSSATVGATASPISGGTSQRVAAPRGVAESKREHRSPATAIARDEPQQAHAHPHPHPNPNPNPDPNPDPNRTPNSNWITRSRVLSAHAQLHFPTY